MRMMPHRCFSTLAILTLASFVGGTASAQEADLTGQVDDLLGRYESALAAGDWQTMRSLFVEEPTLLPMTGGTIEGWDGIQAHFEELGLVSFEVTSTMTEALGDTLILDVGTWTGTLPEAAGGITIGGEYAAVGEAGESGLRIRDLITFPTRQPPGAPAP